MNNLILISESEFRAVLSEILKSELATFRPVDQPKDNSLITRQEAAELLGISLPTLSTYAAEGRVQSYRIGSRIRYKRDEVLNSVSAIKSRKYK